MSELKIEVGPLLFQFRSFHHWVDKARSLYAWAGVRGDDTVCIDRLGRVCGWGLHFKQAHEDDAFPINVYALRPEGKTAVTSGDQK